MVTMTKKNYIPFEQAEFLLSTLFTKEFPKRALPEIALIGKSNVGKSSLINHLLKRKSLAKVSSYPGKTRSLHFFLIDDKLHLVDLPGYGYAKVARPLKDLWGKTLEEYFQTRDSLKLLLFLIDIRRTPTEEDLSFYKWAEEKKIPFLFVLTKADKIKKGDLSQSAINFFQKTPFKDHTPLPYSILDSSSRSLLIQKINEKVYGTAT